MINRSVLFNEINNFKNKMATTYVQSYEELYRVLTDFAKEEGHLFVTAQENHCLVDLLRELTQHIKDYLIPTVNHNGDAVNRFASLYECACQNSDIYNRLKNDRRSQVENAVHKHITEKFDPVKSLHYLSFGSGGLLQDFLIIAKLMLAGYKNIHVSLVDTENIRYHVKNTEYEIMKERYLDIKNGKKDQHTISDIDVKMAPWVNFFEKWLTLCAAEMNAQFSVSVFNSIDEFALGNIHPDVIVSIDNDSFTNASFNDTIKAHQTLHDQGLMFLYSDQCDLVFSKQGYIDFSCKKTHGVINFTQVPTSHLRIANISEPNTSYVTYLCDVILPYIDKYNTCSPLSSITLTLPALDPNNTYLDLDQDKLSCFIKLLIPRQAALIVKHVAYDDNLDRVLPQLDHDQDLLICYMRNTTTLFQDVAALHDHCMKADMLCGMLQLTQNNTLFANKGEVYQWTWDNSTKIAKNFDGSAIPDTLNKFYQHHAQKESAKALLLGAGN